METFFVKKVSMVFFLPIGVLMEFIIVSYTNVMQYYIGYLNPILML